MRSSPLPEEKAESMVHEISQRSHPVGAVKDLGPLIERLSQSNIVMLGEASHGTHEFYEWRRLISEWLVVKHGFKAIAVEGDWPACRQVDDYVQNSPTNTRDSARQVLESFRRWPTWMWSNTEVVRLAEWMKSHNRSVGGEDLKVGFYGLDVYSMFESIHEVIHGLKKINPFLARRFQNYYSCFDRYQANEKAYVRSLLEVQGCEEAVKRVLHDLIAARKQSRWNHRDALDLEQNALVVKNAESYYRAMIHADDFSWNVRDQHMLETLETLIAQKSKVIVWAHNTHIGDHRATDMHEAGMVNLGGLAREKWGHDQVALVGFGTHQGTVIASRAWDGPIQKMQVPPSTAGSYDSLFHEAAVRMKTPCLYSLLGKTAQSGILAERHGQRAIGVVYDPAHERYGNYVPTSLAHRYDAFFFIDETRALQPLIQEFDHSELPETWPQGQ
ncbi:MAG: erythromycin esterase family protein [Methylotenera sp.]|nr:erythromycin esterase family protein [Oligoflexia bacterium]